MNDERLTKKSMTRVRYKKNKGLNIFGTSTRKWDPESNTMR